MFNLNNYLGKWYEVARIENEFEPQMQNVTAEYTLNDDNSIKVVNSGYINNEFKEIVGKAITTNDEHLLKVSFFGNFYSDYRILYIDNNYQYAIIGGNSDRYLWILSRIPYIEEKILVELLDIIALNGYDRYKVKLTEQKY